MSKLTNTDLQVLQSVNDYGTLPATSPEKGAGLEQHRFEVSRAKLLAEGLITPASKGRLAISNAGIRALKTAMNHD